MPKKKQDPAARKYRRYSDEAMAAAIKECRAHTMTQGAAAAKYGVPPSTLSDRLSGKFDEHSVMGGQTVFTPAEEQKFVNYISQMQDIGYPITPMEFRFTVKRMLDIDGRKTPFNFDGIKNLPGKHWYEGFMERHSLEISIRKSQSVSKSSACVTMGQIENWFKGCRDYISKNFPGGLDALADPKRKFNCDETGCPLDAKTNRIGVMARRGSKQVFQVQQGTKQQITTEVCFNAAGDMMHPFFVFPGQRMGSNINFVDFDVAYRALTPNGWMDQDTFVLFLERVDQFIEELKIKKPVILFFDGHISHMSLEAALFARAKLIILYCLAEYTSRITQPGDVGYFGPFKLKLPGAIRVWQMNHILQPVTKYVFPEIFKTVWDQVNKKETLINAFRKAGLHPFGAEHIDKERLLKYFEDQHAQNPSADVPMIEDVTQQAAEVQQTSQQPTEAQQMSQQPTEAQQASQQSTEEQQVSQQSTEVQQASQQSTEVQQASQQSTEAQQASQQSAEVQQTTQEASEVQTSEQATVVQQTPVIDGLVQQPPVSESTTPQGPIAPQANTLQPDEPRPGCSGDPGTHAASHTLIPKSTPLSASGDHSAAAYMKRLPRDYVSPAIDQVMRVPVINPRPNRKPRFREIMPKCVSGKEAIEILQRRKDEKEAMERQKEEKRVMRETLRRMKKEESEKKKAESERKKAEREEAKRKKQEEREKKQKEKEERKRQAEENKAKKGKGKAKAKQAKMDSDVESTDESDTEKKTKRLEKKLSKQDALYVDDDQMSSEDEGATICPKCKEELSDAGIGPDQPFGCDNCTLWFHRKCLGHDFNPADFFMCEFC